ncbi:MAG: ABC transporter substrate-binding protein [Clostridiales bacterium]|nr:ABC transporter substrate-binding protein [Clostridiales bacterium]
MKKVLIIVFAIILTVAVLVSCTNTDKFNTITISLPDGAPALAVAKLMKDFTYKGYNVNFEIVSGVQEITASLSQKSTNIAILPTNIASKLYSQDMDIKLISSNVFGVLYIVGTEDIDSLDQLKGQKILSIGQGATPDFMLQYILQTNGIGKDQVTIQYVKEASEAIPQLKAGSAKFAVLGEPAVTMSTQKADTKILFNLQEEWQKLTGFAGYPQVSTVATGDTVKEHKEFLLAFNKAMQENVEWIKDNYEGVNSILYEKGSMVSFGSNKVIENCNVDFVTASQAKENVTLYLETMQAFNPAFVGEIPDDAFYQDIK